MKKIFYKYKGEIKDCNVQLLENEDGTVALNIDLVDYEQFEESGTNYFEVLLSIRNTLNSRGIEILCNGTSVDVYPSAMQLGMGGGDRAYRLKLGCHTHMVDIIETFEYDSLDYKEGTLKEQKLYHEKWVLSKKKLEPREPIFSVNNVSSDCQQIYFWGHQPSKNGAITKSCLSQWWPCEFKDDNGTTYSSTEQWMMAEKARIFSDHKILEEILDTKNPKEAKELGRKVALFDNDVWDERSYDIVVEGNLLKFSQNKNLFDYLIGTGDSVLIEASPYDKIWGIGMKQNDEGIVNPNNWQGKNLLGFALMEVRDILKEQDQLV